MLHFCKPVSSKKRFAPHRRLNSSLTFTLYEKAADILQNEWLDVIEGKDLFLHPEYLRILEKTEHTSLKGRYVQVYRHGHPCGVIYFQIIDFHAGVFGQLLSAEVNEIRSRRMSVFEKYVDSNKNEVLLRLFTCGNNVISGNHGFLFKEEMGQKQVNECILEITDLIAKEEKIRGTIAAILLKDFESPLQPAKMLEENKYSLFQVEPNLVVDIPAVDSVDGYLALFSKKYRNRAKSVFKKLEGVEVRILSEEEIAQRSKEIYRLYENIFNNAKFKLFKLPEDYFLRVKSAFPEQFWIKGYFVQGELAAFCSVFHLPDGTLEAHYIGLDYKHNEQYELYQNILWQMIREAIARGAKRVNLGRTAAEIKTTVGAKPVDLICYIRPQNTISRIIQKPFIRFLQPAQWTPRNPFKEETAATVSAEEQS